MLKRITPAQAGEALARGIERRAPRVIAPRWWAIGSVLRGVLGPPMDYLATRAPRIRQALSDSEAGAAGAARVSGATAAVGSGEEVSKEAG